MEFSTVGRSPGDSTSPFSNVSLSDSLTHSLHSSSAPFVPLQSKQLGNEPISKRLPPAGQLAKKSSKSNNELSKSPSSKGNYYSL